ncbi:hypothetical protein QO009_004123 [Brevibacillus aydinogluensis]|uniref:hypothetical protein n=1 Tax=Brevibacillus aydinogluensis TaxID=927786 RepID=UPI002892AFB1|nr:hypothetical protein [Brevibacillus aydinogluensis]MDT3418198.1 hypothetical protein [Brevibacillus aydinogluensis]
MEIILWLLSNKSFRKWIIVACAAIFFLGIIFLGTMSSLSVGSLSGSIPLLQPSDKVRQLYESKTRAWSDELTWHNPITRKDEKGLPEEVLNELHDLGADLSPGLILALAMLGGKDDEETAEKLVKILAPKQVSVKEYKVTVTVTVHKNKGEESTGTTHEYPVLKVTSVDTYNGVRVYEYKYRDRRVVKETDSGMIVTTYHEPYLYTQNWSKDYSRLEEAMSKMGLRGEEDRKLLLKQAFLLDPEFSDPDTFTILPEMDEYVGGSFTGHSSGPYSFDTVVTEDSGVTLSQIAAILKGTPMEGTAAAFMEAGRRFGIDPAFLVGIAGAEQSFRPFNNNAFGITGVGDAGSERGFAAYSSMEVGIFAAAKLLSGRLYVGSGLVTIEQIWRRWAPGEAANDPNHLNQNWAVNVVATMNRLRSMK